MTESLDMLVFGAHPDDAEIGMGGTISRHTAAGWKVGICDLTYAELSSNGTVETRLKEADTASHLLQLAERTNLGLPDRGLRPCKEHLDLITLEIRKFRPRIVMAPYWHDRHPDHMMCSRLVEEAVFNSKLRKYLPNVPAWKVESLYFYFINDTDQADFIVDVSDYHDQKMKSLQAYQSQFQAVESGEDIVQTPLNQRYLERIQQRDYLLGQQAATTYAEGFKSKQPILMDLLS